MWALGVVLVLAAWFALHEWTSGSSFALACRDKFQVHIRPEQLRSYRTPRDAAQSVLGVPAGARLVVRDANTGVGEIALVDYVLRVHDVVAEVSVRRQSVGSWVPAAIQRCRALPS